MMSIEEAAKESFKKISVNGMREITESRAIEIFKAGALFMQRWIPVDEELPEIKDKSYQILVKTLPTPSGTILNRVIAVFSFESEITLKSKLKHYTHWRPIEIKK